MMETNITQGQKWKYNFLSSFTSIFLRFCFSNTRFCIQRKQISAKVETEFHSGHYMLLIDQDFPIS
jgi:hypothetical protein